MLDNYQGGLRIGSVDIDVTCCSLFLIPPELGHDLKGLVASDQETPPERYSLWIEKEWVSTMLAHCNEMRKLTSILGDGLCIQFSQPTAEEVKSVINQIDYKTSSLEQLSVLFRVFSVITQDKKQVTLCSSDNVKFESEKDKIEALSQYLNQHYAQDISLHDLSQYIFCSERTVNRIFTRHFGETFSQRLKKIRLSHAARLLETSNFKVSHICQMVGYNNASNFNRLFLSYKGLTPKAYRSKFSN
ncbi:helix-turn-helix transcriptional regulator [Vibrio sp. 404]|uniref:Helix-turn-helix transcriptional regulator n=1 Tax=Vibrio marinisediminis TaxID=2758441 RepID=A0A7W2FMQ6_9VIBR|nr:AraC family transcriptional regulator [Vibrio marinisediminis]MBA5760951.1 helix-turn-helix transcriptional regulator [Vibrio marinisediminis]